MRHAQVDPRACRSLTKRHMTRWCGFDGKITGMVPVTQGTEIGPPGRFLGECTTFSILVDDDRPVDMD